MKKELIYDYEDYWRLGFHLMPPEGWLNDPNGLCWFQDYYHVFFQYSPDDPAGGIKHWGHYRSRNLLEWEYMGIALSPEEPYDRDGVYSGSAIVNDQGMHLFYTGNVKMAGDFDFITEGRQSNTIHVQSKDGLIFSEKRCILNHDDYPKHMTCHIRDPKIWIEDRGHIKAYCMILGARNVNNQGEALIYKSENLFDWFFVGEVMSPEELGFMWECPDVFEVNGTKVLCISPQGIKALEFDYQNVYQSGYFTYEGNLTGIYNLGRFKEWDRGFDFYAPQTFEDGKGRRILIGWMGAADTPQHENPTIAMGWQHALTIPREITVTGGQLRQVPIEELKKLRHKKIELDQYGNMQLYPAYEAVIENHGNANLRIMFSETFQARYDAENHIFSILFTNGADGDGKGRGSRRFRLADCRKAHIFVDTSSVEIFLNDGEEVFTTRFYPQAGKSNLSVLGDRYHMDIWELSKMKITEF